MRPAQHACTSHITLWLVLKRQRCPAEHELTLAELESACGPRSTPTKASTYTFSLSDVIQ